MDDDGDDKDDSKRRTRNLSEKKRRDQFNMLVNELSTLISTNNRKMDKSTVLKSAISFLKNHNEITVRSRAHDVHEDWKPSFLPNEEFTFLVLEAIEGFILVFSGNGRINYVSEGIMSLLDHNPADILNTSVYDLMPDVDRQHIYNVLHQSGTMDPLQLSENDQETRFRRHVQSDNEIRFQCHFKRGTLDFRNEATYELIDFIGRVRTNIEPQDSEDRQGYRQEDSRLLFVCTGRLHSPQLIRDESLLDCNRSEFTSRHSLEWKFLFLDHRAPPIIGYLPFEVLGTSGYDYYHFDDLEKVITCHEILMQKGELTSCYYRFLTKGQQWIWLQTRFYITYHQWNSKPEFVVCTHRVVSYEDMAKGTKTEAADEEASSEVENSNSQRTKTEQGTDDAALRASPSYYSDNNDSFTSYRQHPAQSVKSTSQSSNAGTVVTVGTGNASWACEPRRYDGSDCASVSGDSKSSQRDNIRDLSQSMKTMVSEGRVVPQHGMGTQYLEPMPFVSAAPVLPALLPPLPVIVSPDHAQAQVTPTSHTHYLQPFVPVIVSPQHAQAQEQLQRKHEQLQQMIMHQQEELRQVKEQLLLARLGMLQPILPVPGAYPPPEEAGPVEPGMPLPVAGEPARNAAAAYPPQAAHVNNHHMPHMSQ